MKFLHPKSKEAEKMPGKQIRLNRINEKEKNHATQKRRQVQALFDVFIKNLQSDKKTYTPAEIEKITVLYVLSRMADVPTNNTQKVAHEIQMKQIIQQIKNGTFQVPDLTNELNVVRLQAWDGRLETSQAVKLCCVEIPNIEDKVRTKK